MLEKDCGDIATRMNITSRIGTEMVAVQIMMPVATRASALQERIVHQMDCRPALSAIVVDVIEKCGRNVRTSSRMRAVGRACTSRDMAATTGSNIARCRHQEVLATNVDKIVKAHAGHDDT